MSVLTWSPSSTSGVDPLPVRQMNSRGGGLHYSLLPWKAEFDRLILYPGSAET